MEISRQINSVTKQSPNAVVMIRPHHFISNPETVADNAFQQQDCSLTAKDIEKNAHAEVTQVVDTLTALGIQVHLFEDESRQTPDSVFPNNWFSTHPDGLVGIYPMYSNNRRLERRSDIIEFLQANYKVKKIIDYSDRESVNQFLEGTGSMVLDHSNHIAYAVISNRMNLPLFKEFCRDFNYQPMAFNASDASGIAIYHTNVLMSVSTEFALTGLSLIKDLKEQEKLVESLTQSGKKVIELSAEQINQFAGNMLELDSPSGKLLVMSTTAFESLKPQHIASIENYVKIVVVNIPTLELAGGSIRCMLAGIHLAKK